MHTLYLKAKTERIKHVANNVHFNPPKERIWYRAFTKIGNPAHDRCLHSYLRIGQWQISLAYFIHNNIDGYTCIFYELGVTKEWLDLQNGNYIRANNIASAEKQALIWVETIIWRRRAVAGDRSRRYEW